MSAKTLRVRPEVREAADTQQWLQEARQAGHTDRLTRQHRDPRTAWHAPLEVHVLPRCGDPKSCYATAHDISAGGIGFKCQKPIPPYTRIYVCRAGETAGVPAMSLECTQTLAGYIIGAEFRPQELAQAQQALAKVG